MNRGNPLLVPRLWRFDPERSTAEVVMLGLSANSSPKRWTHRRTLS
jgi:hypothetical protein